MGKKKEEREMVYKFKEYKNKGPLWVQSRASHMHWKMSFSKGYLQLRDVFVMRKSLFFLFKSFWQCWWMVIYEIHTMGDNSVFPSCVKEKGSVILSVFFFTVGVTLSRKSMFILIWTGPFNTLLGLLWFKKKCFNKMHHKLITCNILAILSPLLALIIKYFFR